MTNYARGRAFEYRVRNELRSKGYVVIRSASSKGAADLVAIRPPRPDEYQSAFFSHWILFIQCKLSNRAVPVDEWNELYRLADKARGVPVLAQAGGVGAPKKYYLLLKEKNGKGGPEPLREFEP